MTKTVPGVIHGRTIELTEEIGLMDGQEIEVTVRVVTAKPKWGEGILRSAGAMAPHWTEEDDRILEELHLDRKRTSQREIPE